MRYVSVMCEVCVKCVVGVCEVYGEICLWLVCEWCVCLKSYGRCVSCMSEGCVCVRNVQGVYM